MVRSFANGEEVALRYFFGGRLFGAVAARVLRDADEIALWVPIGAEFHRPARQLTVTELCDGRWDIDELTWARNDVLMLHRPGARHSRWIFWRDGAERDGWYVNLEEPWRRTAIGFDTSDQMLDVVIENDGSWRWKDEDHLTEAVTRGSFAAAEAAEIRAEGQRVLDEFPFPTGWEEQRPPAAPPPRLPSTWDAA